MSRDLLTFIGFIFGSILGSFLNVLIFRLPKEESIVSPPSHCPDCGYRIPPWQNIPIVSYLFLRGRCHSCGNRISIQYPLIELLSGLIAAIVIWTMGLNWAAVSLVIFIYLLGVMTMIDIRYRIIPDTITISGIILGIILTSLQYPGISGLVQSALGVIIGGGALYLIALFGDWLFKKESMGGGDIKLAGMFGAFLGWKLTLLGLFFGFVVGAFYGGIMIALNKLRSDTANSGGNKTLAGTAGGSDTTEDEPLDSAQSATAIPFGPALGIGAVLSLFWGEALLRWYLTTFF